jgi:hypothetical protein
MGSRASWKAAFVQQAWDSFRSGVTLVGVPTAYCRETCDQAAQRLGIGRFPPSYCEYVKLFGYGEWSEDLFICAPCDPSLVGSVEELANDLRSVFAECWASYEGTKEPERMGRFIHFATTTMSFSFAWDPMTRRADGEMGIYLVDFPDTLEYCCHDLLTFLRDFWVGGKINDVYLFYGGVKWKTGPVFTVQRPQLPVYRRKGNGPR